jgi:coenzyme F420-dependent glucose-6-phosphate dehydrogenase
MKICYHASHEQFPPSQLLDLTQQAEAAGFDGAMSSDHFKPWSRSQGHSGFSWSWMGAALARTRFPIGMIVAPGYRYHPAVVAQAAATLEEMFPGRFWLALGSGERLNEDVCGQYWPSKPQRNERLREAADVIRRLLNGERVDHAGTFTAMDAEIFSRPAQPPPLLGAAVSLATAQFVAPFTDGLLTVGSPGTDIDSLLKGYRHAAGAQPVHVQIAVNWAPTRDGALRGAFDHWRFLALGGDVNWELRSPEDFEAATRHVRPPDLERSIFIFSDPNELINELDRYEALGVAAVYVHQVDLNQKAFIEMMQRHVLPRIRAG